MSAVPAITLEPVGRRALEEDLAGGDPTTASCVPVSATARAAMRAREAGVVAGLDAAATAFRLVDPSLSVTHAAADGDRVGPGDTALEISGPARAILMAERTALNFATLLGGVATLTARHVAAVEGTGAAIAPTRKTLPGLRALQKAAVEAGGGAPHRFGLGDAVLIKDNHVAAAGGVAAAVRAARAAAGHMRVVSVEVDTLDQLDAALAEGPHAVLLDNFTLEALREAVRRAAGRAVLEASGGVTLETVRAIAETGVDVISVGALTHSAPALDLGLDFLD